MDRVKTSSSLLLSRWKESGSTLWIEHRELAELVREVLSRGQRFQFQAYGQSMWPFIHPGDRLLIEPLRSKPPRVGDVVLYQTVHGSLVAHRVVRALPPTPALPRQGGGSRECLHLRGDRLWAPLEPVHPRQLLGRVAAIERDHQQISLTATQQRLQALAWLALRPVLRMVRRRLGVFKRTLQRVVFLAQPLP